jgi:hypothetical protein
MWIALRKALRGKEQPHELDLYQCSPLTDAANHRVGKEPGADYANQFIEEMKKSGFIQQAIERANLKGAVVPR